MTAKLVPWALGAVGINIAASSTAPDHGVAIAAIGAIGLFAAALFTGIVTLVVSSRNSDREKESQQDVIATAIKTALEVIDERDHNRVTSLPDDVILDPPKPEPKQRRRP